MPKFYHSYKLISVLCSVQNEINPNLTQAKLMTFIEQFKGFFSCCYSPQSIDESHMPVLTNASVRYNTFQSNVCTP